MSRINWTNILVLLLLGIASPVLGAGNAGESSGNGVRELLAVLAVPVVLLLYVRFVVFRKNKPRRKKGVGR